MSLNSKKKGFKGWLRQHKGIVIGSGSFLLAGLIALLIGYEIKENGHAIRKFLASPHATTFFILVIVGLFLVGILVASMIYMKKGDE